ncbi:MAG: site-2 protease family protein [Pirellulales bacterium]
MLSLSSLPLAAFDPGIIVVILKVAAALGFVIFVHELGHFAVAKMCGVKCEKFYLGFDIYGLKLAKFQWGETEYGIGILPLGGYVKMLGQEDNPTKAYEEMQRAKEGQATGDPNAPVFDPRSYLAQSVPKRMAIISAGVVMNLIFAFLMAALAYGIGVPYSPSGVSLLEPGAPAWQAGLQVGDEIVAINGKPCERYSDLRANIALANLETGVDLTIRRRSADSSEPREMHIQVHPMKGQKIPRIGVAPPESLELADTASDKTHPARFGSPAAKVMSQLDGGKRIVAVNDARVESYADLIRELATHAQEPIQLTVVSVSDEVEAKDNVSEIAASSAVESSTVIIEPASIRDVGLIMKMGAITAVRANSPAAIAGLKEGDRILRVDGQPIEDPLRWPAQVRHAGERAMVLQVRNNEQDSSAREVTIAPSATVTFEWPNYFFSYDQVLSVPELGIAFSVENVVAAVLPGSPAEAAGIKAGDQLATASFLVKPPSEMTDAEKEFLESQAGVKAPLEFADDKANWVACLSELQYLPADTQIKLKLASDREITLTPVSANDWFNPDRGLQLEGAFRTRTATSVGEAFALGGRETLDSVLQVYRFLQKLGHQIDIREIRGPITIARIAGSAASAGFVELLMFLVMLSANLAVLNFLPIPMLDGGHMLFLIIEGIRRKPVSERVFVAFQFAGILFLMSLMAFALFGDVRDLLQ